MDNNFFKTLILLICMPLWGQAQEVIDLYDTLPPNSLANAPKKDSLIPSKNIGYRVSRVGKPQLELYLPAKGKSNGGAIIICPGGGYAILAIDHEGREIAQKMLEKGYTAFVLKYRLPDPKMVKNKTIVPLQDAQRAIQLVRENAAKWHLDPGKIGLMGSSAGGHLASTAGTHFEKSYIDNPKGTSLRPDFLALNYPVISFSDEFSHMGSRFRLIGPELKEEDWKKYKTAPNGNIDWTKIPVPQDAIEEYSNELNVNANTPPTFIQHALDDKSVKIENAILFLAALHKHGIKTGSFFYEKGGHGYGLDNPTSDQDWFEPLISWLNETLHIDN